MDNIQQLAAILPAVGGIGFLITIFTIGGVWAVVRYTVKENTRRITNLESSKGELWSEVNKLGLNVASMDGKLDTLLNLSIKKPD